MYIVEFTWKINADVSLLQSQYTTGLRLPTVATFLSDQDICLHWSLLRAKVWSAIFWQAVVWDHGSSLRLGDESKVAVVWHRYHWYKATTAVAWAEVETIIICTPYLTDVPKFFCHCTHDCDTTWLNCIFSTCKTNIICMLHDITFLENQTLKVIIKNIMQNR